MSDYLAFSDSRQEVRNLLHHADRLSVVAIPDPVIIGVSTPESLFSVGFEFSARVFELALFAEPF
ncbi:MAG: hypothetical protein O6930_04155 [Gammaproteobacteria bacterium]|nr:hypothetical protein [Gammaproteobacteria bacterium]